jgi:hypothetical protein
MLSSTLVFSADNTARPLDVVNARMDAYNKHDIKTFLNTYSEDVQVFTYPNIPLGEKGKAHLKKIFGPMFKEGGVQVKIHHQIVQGKHVINHETVSYGGKDTKYVSIYEIEKGVIKSVQFVRE